MLILVMLFIDLSIVDQNTFFSYEVGMCLLDCRFKNLLRRQSNSDHVNSGWFSTLGFGTDLFRFELPILADSLYVYKRNRYLMHYLVLSRER